jgi:hypothetical protein
MQYPASDDVRLRLGQAVELQREVGRSQDDHAVRRERGRVGGRVGQARDGLAATSGLDVQHAGQPVEVQINEDRRARDAHDRQVRAGARRRQRRQCHQADHRGGGVV